MDKLQKVAYIGNNDTLIRPVNGYIQDLRIYPGSDTSTDHYTNGLPYYDPEKLYGKQSLSSLDKFGNSSGTPQEAGRIIEEYDLDGQYVTKWDTGRMEILNELTITSNQTTSNKFGTTSGDIFYNSAELEYVETFTTPPYLLAGNGSKSHTFSNRSETGYRITIYHDTNMQILISISSIGRWK
jgi:hypothetical protein